jgi:hypothetical protein
MNGMHKTARRRLRPQGSAAVIGEAPAVSETLMPIIDRPDGYYWRAPNGKQEFGPFESFEAARADRDRFDEERPVPGESLQQAESELGISDWIDAETGEPAEGQSPPHLDEE